MFLFALISGIANAENHAISSSNFTMIDNTGALVGGATDVSGTFDDTLICTDVSCTDLSMTLQSSQAFFGNSWTAHDIRTFSEGSYTFDTNCTGADIAAGTTDCGGGAPLSLTVGPGQLGAHMLFDWSTTSDIDVVVVWNIDDSFGSPIYDAAGTADEDLTQTPTRIWNVASKDGNGDGIQGIPMVDGAFPGFNANFNLDMVPPLSAPDKLISSSNFTMLDPTGNLLGGATDVMGTFDDTKICDSTACTDIAMTLSSNQPFNGIQWFAHDIRVFSAGSYTFDTNCTSADISAGITDCSGGAGPFIDLMVDPGQLGAHMLFDYSPSTDIDLALLWDLEGAFGDPIYDGCQPPTPPADCDPTQTPTRRWNLVSRDGNGDGLRGIPMVDGPFVSFNANFNLDVVPRFSLPNIPPTAFDFSASTVVDVPTRIDMTGHASDPDGALDPTSAAIVPGSGPNHGTLVNNGDGTVTYTPTLVFVSPPTDSFQYTIDDDFGVTSNVATVTITVTVVANTPPVANDTPVATDEDISLDITVDSVASDTGGGDSLAFDNFDATSAEGGTVVVDPANTILTYTPAPDFNGLDTFSYFVTDGLDSSNMATVTVTVNAVDDPPVCTDVSLNTETDTPLAISVDDDLLSTCTDPEGDTITLDSTTQPTQPGSTLSDDGAGTLTYTPAPDFNGQDSFTYTATDGANFDTRTVLVDVANVGDVGEIFGNFTMLDSDGVTFGGTNDIVFTWDGTCYNSVAEADAGPENMVMGSDSSFPFFGFPWFAHDIKVYCPGGPYTIDSCNAGVTPPDCGPLTMTVPAGHLGGHILFDWNVTSDIDVAIVWDNSTGGTWQNVVPTGQLYQGPTGPTPALDEFYEWISVDADGDGIPGILFVDGPFINFRANFNFKTTQSGGGEVEIPVSSVSSPNLGSATSGCSIAKGPDSNLLKNSDWLVLAGFMVWCGVGARRRHHQRPHCNQARKSDPFGIRL